MKKNYLYLLFLSSFIAACSSIPDKALNEIINDFSYQMEKEHDVFLIGSGFGGTIDAKFKAFILRFTVVCYMDINQARELIIHSSERLLNQINSNGRIQPWLSQHPYDNTNLDLMFSFNENEFFERVSAPNIALASLHDGIIFYSTYENDKFVLIKKETYEEALNIYKTQPNITY